jgi:hypothetical protein
MILADRQLRFPGGLTGIAGTLTKARYNRVDVRLELSKGRLQMGTRTLDLGGLPEPIARALEVVAEMARKMGGQQGGPSDKAPELPVWPLGVIGTLSREEMYRDYACRS